MARGIILAFGVSVLLLLAATPAAATVLTFESLSAADGDPVPGAYGDNVDPVCDVNGCCDTTGCYGEGNGFTPDVTVGYRTLDPATGATTLSHVGFWTSFYGDLTEVAYPAQNNRLAEISLTPAPGYEVILNGFDLGGWNVTDRPAQTVRVLDADDNVLLDLSPQVIQGTGAQHTHVDPGTPIVAAGTLKIQFGPSWYVGIDNVDFEQQLTNDFLACAADLATAAAALVACTGNLATCAADLVATQSDLEEADGDLTACRGDLDTVTTERDQATTTLGACAANLADRDDDLATCSSDLTATQSALAGATADADTDSHRDADDRCPGSAAAVPVDAAGCSQAQFCATIDARTAAGRKACLRVDWHNDEPLMARAGRDCLVDRALPGADDDRCLPAPE